MAAAALKSKDYAPVPFHSGQGRFLLGIGICNAILLSPHT